MKIISIPGAFADNLGARILRCCATAAGVAIITHGPTKHHADRLFRPDAGTDARHLAAEDLGFIADRVNSPLADDEHAFIGAALKGADSLALLRTTTLYVHADTPTLPSSLPAAALALAESMTDALNVHIYNDDPIPIDSGYVYGINAVYDALALPRPDIETAPFFVLYEREGNDQGETEHYAPFADFGDAMEHATALMQDKAHPALTARVIERTDRDDVPLWHYDATFADNEGESVMFTTTVPGRDGEQAHERGRQFLEAMHGEVRKVDAKLYQVLG